MPSLKAALVFLKMWDTRSVPRDCSKERKGYGKGQANKNRQVGHHQTKDGHPPSKGWSPTIQRMVTHHPKDGHPPFKIYQKEVYYRLEIWNLALTHKIKTRCSAAGQPPSPGWSPTIRRMVTHHQKSTSD